jgi:hypothetical protein
MASLYDLIGADEPTAAEQAAAMQKALRRQSAAGVLGSLTGDKVLGQVGQGLQAGAQRGEAQLADVGQFRMQQATARRAQDETARQHSAQMQRMDAQTQNERARIGLERQRLDADAFAAVADPVSGGIVIFNKKTGQRVGQMPGGGGGFQPPQFSPGAPMLQPGDPGAAPPPGLAGGRPGASAALGAGGMKEAQRTAAVRAGEGSIGMNNAIQAGFPANKGVPGLVETAGWGMARAGLQAVVPERLEQQAGFWQNVADPIVRARTGAAMPVQEFQNQTAMLIPRPGEAPGTHIKKAQQLVALFKNATAGLPPQVQQELLGQLDALEKQLPADEAGYAAMKGGGAGPQQKQRTPVTRNGVTRYWNGSSYED